VKNELSPNFNEALGSRYRIERELGRGRMATVYVAEDQRHGRRVAVKVLRPDASIRHADVRFMRETKLLAQLSHPNIVPLHDSGFLAGHLYYISSYVAGESLRARLNRDGHVPVEEAVRIACDVAEALEYAHRRGVVHRDIKPENILLGEDHALVADFGFAKTIGALTAAAVTTVGGIGPGTPRYMSPEQALADRDLDGRSDVYSLGVVLYEMLTGQTPYRGATGVAENTQKFTRRPDPPSSVRPDVPPRVDAAVLGAITPNRAERIGTAREFAQALRSDDVALRPLGKATASPGTSRIPVPMLIGAAVLAAAGAAAAVIALR
jgi:eukaryotic-like serine/threonine-protein kinase